MKNRPINLLMSLLDSLIMGFFLLAPLIAIFYLKTFPSEVKRTHEGAKAQLRCLTGKCFLMPQESLFATPLVNLKGQGAFVGDRVMTLGEGSELEIIFPDTSKLILRNTSLLSIQKGRGTLLRELEKGFESDPADPNSKDDTKEQKAQSIIYVGNLPVEVLYPTPNSEIIPESFPASIRVSFRIADQITATENNQKELLFNEWTLYSLDKEFKPTLVDKFTFTEGSIPNHYSQKIIIKRTGLFLLAPSGLDAGLSYNGFRFSVFDRSQLESKIQDLLDNYDSSKDKPLEIRQE